MGIENGADETIRGFSELMESFDRVPLPSYTSSISKENEVLLSDCPMEACELAVPD